MWDKERNHHLFTHHNLEAAEQLIDLADRFSMMMKLKKGLPTLQSFNMKNYTRMDNVWCSEAMQGMVVQCDTEPKARPPKTDYFPVVTELAYELIRNQVWTRRNFRVANWPAFRKVLEEELNKLGQPTKPRTIAEFKQQHMALEGAIQEVISKDTIVPVTKPCPFVKRWWNSDLGQQRREVGCMSRTSYQKCNEANHVIHEAYRKAQNKLLEDIRTTKREHWHNFLEGVDGSAVFVAGRMASGLGSDGGALCMLTLRNKVGRKEEHIHDNPEKAKVFYKLFYPHLSDHQFRGTRNTWRQGGTFE
ncbi:hypothetical protein BDN71DRAFT_1507051 [Pleurotus eryngii]|uniref:Uncharacterized protein n=1 Tax=Pleurotus eryngii TaxID=5323 RepID=A0A9P5ZWU6_PLEER|nr:hypothetical protein BDN71DRAFT_1507051 [Pleurotus eryngii]